MTIMLHPNKISPKRYRVQDKTLMVNDYFSFKKYGIEGAKQRAEERQTELDSRNKARKLKNNLGINKLFMADGSVKGLRRRYRRREGRPDYEVLAFQVTVGPKKQCSNELTVNNHNFEHVYEKVQCQLLAFHGLESTLEIRSLFKKAKRLYWQSLDECQATA